MDTSFNFYIKDDVNYIICFPEEWFPHIGNSGPINCEQCKSGMINNIFSFYCQECLINVYNYKRGTSDYFNLIINQINFEEYNNYNSTMWKISPKKGTLLMWQSSLLHSVDNNLSNSRIAVSFNLRITKI